MEGSCESRIHKLKEFFLLNFKCVISAKMDPGDGLDNDCDGKRDEEPRDGKDNDGDGLIDEDLEMVSAVFKNKAGYKTILVVYGLTGHI